MANLTELSQWESGIYQLETTDSVEAGTGGISNEQARLLGNRTKWLYDQIIALFRFSPKNLGWFTGLDVGNSTGSLVVSGNIVSAVATASNPDSFITVTMQNAMLNTNYFVRCSIQSIGSSNLDNDIGREVFTPISATQFEISIKELNSVVQNLRFHIEVIQLY